MEWKNLQQKRTLLSIVLALLIVGYGFYVVSQKKDGSVSRMENLATTTPKISDKDSDQDGLPDWEEAVYGSDMFVADTDGDGTNDGEEVRLGRNPLVKGPDDKLPIFDVPRYATSSSDTFGIKKEFYTKFFREEANRSREASFKDLAQNFDPKEFKPSYNLLDLNVTSDNSKVALKEYADSFGKLIDKYTDAQQGPTESEILEEALPKQDWRKLQELQLPAIAYRNFANDLRVLPTPSLFAQSHLLIVNGYDVTSRALRAMIYFVQDPIRGAGAYQAYLAHRIFITQGYAGVVQLLHERAVTFESGDRGAYFKWRWGTSTAITSE